MNAPETAEAEGPRACQTRRYGVGKSRSEHGAENRDDDFLSIDNELVLDQYIGLFSLVLRHHLSAEFRHF